MRGRVASIGAAITLLILLIVLFLSAPTSWTSRESREPVTGHAPYTGWPDPFPWNPPAAKEESQGNPADRLIVKVKLEKEDTSWIQQLEPTWQNHIITIKSMYPLAHPEAHRPDKGRIANSYLNWIVKNYYNLPETIVFLPPTDTYERDTLDSRKALQKLQIPFVQQSGFANLRCPSQKSQTTCNDKVLEPEHPPHELRTLEAKIPKIWETLFGNTTDLPKQIATVPGAKFVVSKAQVQKRSAEEYLNYWTWLNKTIMDDDSSGMLFEYIWHMVFGKDAIFCPEPTRCECDLYGECNGI
jgi:hypothetical protein